jgi:hypothetical protein
MKNYLVLISVILWSFTGLAQTHFTSAHEGTNAEAYTTVWVYSAKIGAANLQAGDEIAIFDGGICVGVKSLSGEISTPTSVKAAKTDPGASNGYLAGHSITVKVWDSSASLEYVATVAFHAGSPATQFADNESVYVDLTVTQSLTLNLTAQNKEYDGSDVATVGYTVTGGTLAGDVTITLTNGKFNSKSAGNGKAVTATITASGADAGNYIFTKNSSTTANITAKSLTIANTVVQNKIYDGTFAAQISGSTLQGIVSPDVVTIGNSTAGTFGQKDIGSGISVSTSMTLSGVDAGNYSLPLQPSGLTANITVRATTINPIANNKVYGNSDPSFTYLSSPSIASGDVFTGALGRVSGENIGSYDYTLGSLTASSNYSFTINTSPKFQILAKSLSLTGLSVTSKVYDGNISAALSGTASLSGIIGSESVTLTGTPVGNYSTANAGGGILVIISGITLSGANSGNYTLNSTLTGNINRKELTVTGSSAQNKVYDGTTSALITGSTLVGKITGDDVALTAPVTGIFAQKGTGVNIDVSASPMTMTGTTAINYTLIYPTGLKAEISKKALTVTAINKSKCFGTTLTFAGTDFTTTGLVTGDAANSVVLTSTGSGADAAAGVYDIIPSGTVGTGLANYTIAYVIGKLTVESLPTPGIVGSASVTQAPAQVTYTTEAGMNNYVWTVTSGGTITSGAGTKQIVVSWTSIAEQSVTVSYSNGNGCSGTSSKSITLFALPTASLSGSTTICPGTSAKLSVVLTGKSPWNLTYSDGTTSKTISNIIASPYTFEVTPIAGTTTSFTITNVSDSNSMSNKGTGTAVVSVSPIFAAPTINSVGSLCYASETVISATLAGTQSSQVKYQWQSSNDNLIWTNINDATTLSLYSEVLLNSIYYRVIASYAGCESKVSNTVKVIVNEPITNAILTTDRQTICYGDIPAKITASPSSGGNGKFTYLWQKKVSDTWININNSTLTYQSEQLTATTTFRLITRDNGVSSCGSVYSNELVINVKSPTLSGTLSADQRIVNGAIPSPITSVSLGSGSGTISYTWESSIDNGQTWSAIAGETGAGYAPKSQTQPIWFRRITNSTENSVICTAVSAPVKITLWPTAVNPTEVDSNNLTAYAIRNVEIKIKGNVSNQAVASLYDIQGKIILVSKLEEGILHSLPTPGIKSGIYLLSVNDKGQIFRFKIPINQ